MQSFFATYKINFVPATRGEGRGEPGRVLKGAKIFRSTTPTQGQPEADRGAWINEFSPRNSKIRPRVGGSPSARGRNRLLSGEPDSC